MHQVSFNFYNQISGGTTQMPRPKSDLTSNPKIVGARLTQELFKEWRKLGGAVWLRKYLIEHKQKREANENHNA
jgi:hypothetical protein